MQAAALLGFEPKVAVLPVEADEAHMAAAKGFVKQARQTFSSIPYST